MMTATKTIADSAMNETLKPPRPRIAMVEEPYDDEVEAIFKSIMPAGRPPA